MSTTTLSALSADAALSEETPLVNEYAVVHEVDMETLSIKAIIPALDPDHVHDSWIRQQVAWVGSPGYGVVSAPAIGSEVLIGSRYGDVLNLYYVSVYNEVNTLPTEFSDGARGAKLETKYRLLADLLIQIVSRESIHLEGANLAEVVGAVVKLICGGSEVLKGEANKIGFLGAAPTGKKTLPAPATDLASCLTLANALRAHEIERGFGQ